MSVEIRLDMFEGPLDLLLHLVEKNELDICKISLTTVADQFLEVVNKSLSLEHASKFLLIAARLMVLKARSILPDIRFTGQDDQDEADTCSDLLQDLKEYRQYKELSRRLEELADAKSKLLSAPSYDLSSYLGETDYLASVSLEKLARIMAGLLESQPAEEARVIDFLEREEISVPQRITEISERLKLKSELAFHELLENDAKAAYVISTFLALLELIQTPQISYLQKKPFAELIIRHSTEE